MKFGIDGLILNLDSFSQTHASHVSFSASVQLVSFASGQTDGTRDGCDQTTYCFIDHEYHPAMI